MTAIMALFQRSCQRVGTISGTIVFMDRTDKFSDTISDVCHDLLLSSGKTVDDLTAATSITRNYWFRHVRHELPFTTRDISEFSRFLGIDPLDVFRTAAVRMGGSLTVREDPNARDVQELKDLLAQAQKVIAHIEWRMKYTIQ